MKFKPSIEKKKKKGLNESPFRKSQKTNVNYKNQNSKKWKY